MYDVFFFKKKVLLQKFLYEFNGWVELWGGFGDCYMENKYNTDEWTRQERKKIFKTQNDNFIILNIYYREDWTKEQHCTKIEGEKC